MIGPGPASLEVEHSHRNFSSIRGPRFESHQGRFFSGVRINAQKMFDGNFRTNRKITSSHATYRNEKAVATSISEQRGT